MGIPKAGSVDPEGAEAHADRRGRRSGAPLHGGAPDLHGARVGESGRSSGRGQDRVACACGCGAEFSRLDRKGRPRRFVHGHGVHVGLGGPQRVDLAARCARRARLEAEAPKCGCGCGERIRLRADFERKRMRNPKWPGFLPGHNRARIVRGPIRAEILGLVYGTLLGDTSVSPPHRRAQPRVYFHHGKCQREWAEYKARRLNGLGIRTRITKNGGYGQMSCVGVGSCHPALNEVCRVVGRPKRVTDEWLSRISEEGWAWWYMDDGSVNRGGITFHTEGFSRAEVRVLAKFLLGMGFSARVERVTRGGYFYLRLGVEFAIRWIRRFRKFCAPGMAYKFPRDYEDHRRPSSWK